MEYVTGGLIVKIVMNICWCHLTSNDIFFTTPIPLDIPSTIDTNFLYILVKRRLVVLNGSIASVSWYYSKTTFFISVLGKLGVKESWTKLFVVGPLLDVTRCIGAEKNGDIFFRKKDGQLVCFNLSTQKTEELRKSLSRLEE
jgi:hypothetical protein